MTPQQAADMAGVSRQALMKQIHEGEFATGDMIFKATRKGRNWNVEAVSAPPTPGKAAPQGTPAGTRSQLELLKVKRLYTQIQLDEQKLAANNRSLRRRLSAQTHNRHNEKKCREPGEHPSQRNIAIAPGALRRVGLPVLRVIGHLPNSIATGPRPTTCSTIRAAKIANR